MEPLHSVAEVIRITEVEVRSAQDRLHHLQVHGIALHLLLSQMEKGSCVGYHLSRGYPVDLMACYSATHLSIHDDNEVTTRQEAYSPNQAPYLPTAGSCWDLTSCASCARSTNFSLDQLTDREQR